MRLTSGTCIGQYEVLALLGEGGMGQVYRARDPRLDREVALKILSGGSGAEPVRRERFVREARAASALAHPNIVTIYEIDTADGVDFIAMEYVRGASLATAMAAGALPLARVLDVGAQIADALAAAHDAGIVHRDLKPSNVMLASTGPVKVLDFGIAKRLDAAGDSERTTVAALTVAGSSLGTPAYMSPEQALGDPVDGRSDLFSFGVVLYEMLAGQLPFQGSTGLKLVRQIVHDPHRPLKSAAPDVPDAIVDIVDRCLAKEPDGRYASAGALRDELRRLAAAAAAPPGTSVTATTAVPAVDSRPSALRSRAGALAAGVLLLALVVWIGGPSIVRLVRQYTTPQSERADVDASPQELLARATDRLGHYYREGNVDQAIAQLERALQQKSPYPIAEARLSLAYGRKDGLSADPEWKKRALAHAERAVVGNDQLAIAHMAVGAASMLAGQQDKAAAEYHTAETLDPANSELLWRLGDLAVARQDKVTAEQLYRRATEAGSREWEPYGKLGAFLYQQGRYTEAIQSFDRMRELAPDHTRAYSNLAAAYHQLNRTDEAAAVLQRGLEIAPDAILYSNLGTYLYFQGKYPEAEHAFDEALKINANAYQRWGNLGDAVRMVEPGSPKMHDSYRRATQLADEELKRRPADPNIRSSLAVYLVRDGQTPRAMTEIDQVLSQKNPTASVLFKATLVTELAGQRSKALLLLGKTLEAGYQLREIGTEPDLVKLRADPEYHRIVSKYEK